MKESKEVSVSTDAIHISVKGIKKPSIYNQDVVLDGKTIFFTDKWKLNLSHLNHDSIREIHQIYDAISQDNIHDQKIGANFISPDKKIQVVIPLGQDQSSVRRFYRKLDCIVTKFEDRHRSETLKHSGRVSFDKNNRYMKSNRAVYGKRSIPSPYGSRRVDMFDRSVEEGKPCPPSRKLTKHQKSVQNLLLKKFETELSDNEDQGHETSKEQTVMESDSEQSNHPSLDHEQAESVCESDDDHDIEKQETLLRSKRKSIMRRRLVKRTIADDEDDDDGDDIFEDENLQPKKLSKKFHDENDDYKDDDHGHQKDIRTKNISSYFTNIKAKKTVTVTPLRTKDSVESQVKVDGGITDDEDGSIEKASPSETKETGRISKYFQKYTPNQPASSNDDENIPEDKNATFKDSTTSENDLSIKKKSLSYKRFQAKTSAADVALATAQSPKRMIKASIPKSPRRRITSALSEAPRSAIQASPVKNPYKTARISTTVMSSSPPTGHMGLKNLGNTCYMGSSIQILFSVPDFFKSLEELYKTLTLDVDTEQGTVLPLSKALINLASKAGIITQTNDTMDLHRGYIDPSELKKAMDKSTAKFHGFQQRDAHEFLSDLLDLLHEELTEAINQSGKRDLTPPTDDFFRLDLDVCLTCNSCNYTRTKRELYRHISVDVHALDTENTDGRRFSLEDGITKFFKSVEHELKCEKCSDGNTVTQTLSISRAPKALLLHMKRFIVSTKMEGDPPQTKIYFRKDTAPVECGSSIELKDAEASLGSYKLKGVVRHIGPDAFSGHYTADALRSSNMNSEWINFDDSLTSMTSISKILVDDSSQRNNYMMMYVL